MTELGAILLFCPTLPPCTHAAFQFLSKLLRLILSLFKQYFQGSRHKGRFSSTPQDALALNVAPDVWSNAAKAGGLSSREKALTLSVCWEQIDKCSDTFFKLKAQLTGQSSWFRRTLQLCTALVLISLPSWISAHSPRHRVGLGRSYPAARETLL